MKITKEKTFEEVAAEAQTAVTIAENGESVHTALLAIQLGLKAPKNKENGFAHFNYRTAGDILERVKPFLASTGCTVSIDDQIKLVGERYYVKSTATLWHIASDTTCCASAYAREGLAEKGKMESQLTGSASTFAKKYALCNLFAIDDSAEDPDSFSHDESAEAIEAFRNCLTLDDLKATKEKYINVVNSNSNVANYAMQVYTQIKNAMSL